MIRNTFSSILHHKLQERKAFQNRSWGQALIQTVLLIFLRKQTIPPFLEMIFVAESKKKNKKSTVY